MAAASSPLLPVGIGRATGVMYNVTGPANLTLSEVSLALLLKKLMQRHMCCIAGFAARAIMLAMRACADVCGCSVALSHFSIYA